MSLLRGQTQFLDHSIIIDKLVQDFLNGADWNITNSNNNATITGLRDGTNPTDAVTYQQLQDAINGKSWKDAVRVLADSNQTLSGSATIDGIALTDGDRVACFSQTTSTEDGVYIVNTGGAWTRADDWAVGENAGSFSFMVQAGTNYADSQWTITNDPTTDVIGTDDLILVQTGGSGSIVAGNGLIMTGNVIDVVATDLSLQVNANDMGVNIGNTNGDSLEVSATGLELLSTITGDRTFSSTSFTVASTGSVNINSNNEAGTISIGNLNNTGDLRIYSVSSAELSTNSTLLLGSLQGTSLLSQEFIEFYDKQIDNATDGTRIPLSMQTTIDHGSGTTDGAIINDFRAAFTDEAIINAIMENHDAILASGNDLNEAYEAGAGNTATPSSQTITMDSGDISWKIEGSSTYQNPLYEIRDGNDNQAFWVRSSYDSSGVHQDSGISIYAYSNNASPTWDLTLATRGDGAGNVAAPINIFSEGINGGTGGDVNISADDATLNLGGNTMATLGADAGSVIIFGTEIQLMDQTHTDLFGTEVNGLRLKNFNTASLPTPPTNAFGSLVFDTDTDTPKVWVTDTDGTGTDGWVELVTSQSQNNNYIRIVRVFADGNIDTASAPATIDGITLNVGDKVALLSQSTTTEDGIYDYNGSGSALTRSSEFATGIHVAGFTIVVKEGNLYADKKFLITNDTGTDVVGTDDLTYISLGDTGAVTLDVAYENGAGTTSAPSGQTVTMDSGDVTWNFTGGSTYTAPTLHFRETSHGLSLFKQQAVYDSSSGDLKRTTSSIQAYGYDESDYDGIVIRSSASNNTNKTGKIKITNENMNSTTNGGIEINSWDGELRIGNYLATGEVGIYSDNLNFYSRTQDHVLFKGEAFGFRLKNHSGPLPGAYYGGLGFRDDNHLEVYVESTVHNNHVAGWVEVYTEANLEAKNLIDIYNGQIHVGSNSDTAIRGFMTRHTVFTDNGAYNLRFRIKTNTAEDALNKLYMEPGSNNYVLLGIEDTVNNYKTQFISNKTSANLEAGDDNATSSIKLYSDETTDTSLKYAIKIGSDWGTFAGAEYEADYSSNYSLRSLVDKEYVDNLIQNTSYTRIVRVFADGNIDTASAPATIDGITLSNGDKIALLNQTTTTEDGIYDYNGSGSALTRNSDFATGIHVAGFTIVVKEGTNNGDKKFLITNDTGTDVVGTDDLTYTSVGDTSAVTLDVAYDNFGTDPHLITVDNYDLEWHLGGSARKISFTPQTVGYPAMLTLDNHAGLPQVSIRGYSENGSGYGIILDDRGEDGTEGGGILIQTNNDSGNSGAGGIDVITESGLNASINFNIYRQINFSDSQIRQATTTTSIPLSMQTTIDHGSGTTDGAIINDFRNTFTDEAIINAIMENHDAILASGNNLNEAYETGAGTTAAHIDQIITVDSGSITWDLQTATANNDFIVNVDGTSVFEIDPDTGFIGLGTASTPGTQFHVHSFDDNNYHASIGATRMTATAGVSSTVSVGRLRGTNFGSPAAVQALDLLGTFVWSGQYSTTPGEFDAGAGFQALATENWDATHRGTRLNLVSTLTGTSTIVSVFTAEGNGVLTIGDTVNYETLVIDDDDIPNKKYVDDAITGITTVWDARTTLNIGNQTATLTTAPSNGFTQVRVYLNGNRLVPTDEFTITNTATGEITMTASQVLTTGDTVIIDYVDA